MDYKKKEKLTFLQRGYSIILVKELKFFHLLCLRKIDGFFYCLDRKESFKIEK